ncbi:hypothetical protein [Candidatus Amarolinea aalborgensis]|uniref:hypothetical protein n=1 Tax=Candidatus Amarolinea aalborgensis TaxID=2249329 RepID=UPI003BF988A6
MTIETTAVIQASVRRMFPDTTIDQALAELLLERVQRNLVKYRSMARQFEVRYDQSFDEFRKAVLRQHPAADVEQNYFDWELAVTGIADMEEQIARMRR